MNNDRMTCNQANQESNGPPQPEYRPRKSSITKFDVEDLDELNEQHEKKKSAMHALNSQTLTAADHDQNSEYSSESEHSEEEKVPKVRIFQDIDDKSMTSSE